MQKMISSARRGSGAAVRSAESWICFFTAAMPAGSPVHQVRRVVGAGALVGVAGAEAGDGPEGAEAGEKSLVTALSPARKRMAASSPALPMKGRPLVKCFRRNWLMAL